MLQEICLVVLLLAAVQGAVLECDKETDCAACTKSEQSGGCKWDVDAEECIFTAEPTLAITVSDAAKCDAAKSCAAVAECGSCVDTIYKDGNKCVWVPKGDSGECEKPGLTTFTDTTVKDKADCGMTNMDCDAYTTCDACMNDVTGNCRWNLDANNCRYKFSGSLFANAVASKVEQCTLKGCRGLADCAACTANKYDGENTCVWLPNDEENKCQTPDASTPFKVHATDADTCAGESKACAEYKVCDKCTLDLGVNGCQWNHDDKVCETRKPFSFSTVAKTKAECSIKSCHDFSDKCEDCVAAKYGSDDDENCVYLPDSDDNKCQKPDPTNYLSGRISEASKCSAKDADCDSYTDCVGCVNDLGVVGCKWNLEEDKCVGKIGTLLDDTASDEEECAAGTGPGSDATTLSAGLVLAAIVGCALI